MFMNMTHNYGLGTQAGKSICFLTTWFC